MKKKLLIFFSVLLFQFSLGQNITFPDQNLKYILVNSNVNYDFNGTVFPPIDANADGEISESEASQVIKLDFGYADISNLQGLEYFINLKSLSFFFANFSQFNLPTLVNLEELTIQNIAAPINLTVLNLNSNINLKKMWVALSSTSLNLSNNVNLEYASIYGLNLTSLNLSNLNALKELNYLGKMPTIDLSDCTNLLNLFCYGNAENYYYSNDNLLTSLDLSNQTQLVNLGISGNLISNLNLSNCTNLETVDVGYNNLTSLNIDNAIYIKNLYCSNNNITSLNLNNQFNLQNVDCQNNQLITLKTKNGIIEEYLFFAGNPTLQSICGDQNEVVYIQNQCNINGYTNVSIVSDCNTSSTRPNISMYPNPVEDMLHLDSSVRINKIEVFGSNGFLIMASESVNDTIDMQVLQSGIYFLKVYSDNDVSVMKFMKA